MRGATGKTVILLIATTFQSTLPMRGATPSALYRQHLRPNFNPRSPCGERRDSRKRDPGRHDFNPRSPCGERRDALTVEISVEVFQSTLPMRGATVGIHVNSFTRNIISIHAPHAGSDDNPSAYRRSACDFNPRSPCGERPTHRWNVKTGATHFNPRSPCGERRDRVETRSVDDRISIHAPHAGSDLCTNAFCR